MKLNKRELMEVISALQAILERYFKEDTPEHIDTRVCLSGSIFKLQHQLKHLEDKEIN